MNNRLEKDFKAYLIEQSRPSAYLGYGNAEERLVEYGPSYGMVEEGDRCCVYFYEWSCVTRGIRGYYSIKAFTDWLDSCNISYTQDDIERIKKKESFFCACPLGRRELVICTTHYALKNYLDDSSKEVGNMMQNGNGCSIVPLNPHTANNLHRNYMMCDYI